MNRLAKWLVIATCVSLLGFFNVAHAEQKSLKAMIPWDGEGRVFHIAPGTMLFLGAFQGVIYVETSEGKLDEGFVSCPLKQQLDLKSRKTSGSGHCMITASGGDTVYAKWTCTGVLGGCKGDFKLTGGTGKFKGITGSSKFIVRSPLRALITDMANDSVLRVSSGIAILPDLKYTLATQK